MLTGTIDIKDNSPAVELSPIFSVAAKEREENRHRLRAENIVITKINNLIRN
jgi:hypothetical protein